VPVSGTAGPSVRVRRRWIAPPLLGILLVAAAAAAPQAADYQSFNVKFAAATVVPAYRALAQKTSEQAVVLERFCREPDAAGLGVARAAFHATMDAWMGIQHVTWGPVQIAFRRERFYYWPERRGEVDRALAGLVARRDADALEPGAFAKQSVAVQGLPALERLLFADDAQAGFAKGDAAGRYRCALALAIGRNLASIASEVAGEWQAKVLPALAAGGSIYFAGPKAATKLFLTDLQNLVQAVSDLKLQPVLGASLETARPDLAESRRSGRASRNIVENLEAAQRMYVGSGRGDGFGAFVKRADDGAARNARLERDFEAALVAARALPEGLGAAAADPAQRERVEAAFSRVEALRNGLREVVPAAAHITLGFTSFGD
jgi:uncharacterized protein